ncbi:uncharacterized protein LOC117646259 [Thrips palmi]|uniref:RNA-directed DNA polymerase n=1 Tax=Thrips palmi TaxID=161013 RepID=A0A6P8Z061_THRPL|nr:uncharacterized protein LOC117646259 [Thrips palmi]
MTHNANLPSQLVLEGNVNQNWKRFLTHFEIYVGACGRELPKAEIDKLEGPAKKAYYNGLGKLLLNIAGEEATNLAATFGLEADDKYDYLQLVAQFDAYAKIEVNDTYERFVFNSCVQQEGETFDHFVTELRKKAKNCGFGDREKDFIRDRIVVGIRNKKVQEALFRVTPLTLEKAITDCRAAEQSRLYSKELQNHSNPAASSVSTDAIKHVTKKKWNNQKKNNNYNSNKSEKDFKCSKCGYKHEYGKCPAYGKQCIKCKEIGHFRSRCPEKKNKTDSIETKKQEEVKTDSYDVYFTDSIQVQDAGKYPKVYRQKIRVEDKVIDFKLDPGASRSVLPVELFRELKTVKKLKKSNVVIQPYGKNTPSISDVYAVDLICTVGGLRGVVNFLVSEDANTPLFSCADCERFGLIKRIEVSVDEMTDEQTAFIQANEDVFTGLGKFPGTHPVLTKPEAEQVIRPALRKPTSVAEKLKPCLDNLVQREIISKVDHLTPECWVCGWTQTESETWKAWRSPATGTSWKASWEIHRLGSRTLQRLRLKLLKYRLTVDHIPGKQMFIADPLSRSFNKDPVADDPTMEEVVHSFTTSLPISAALQQDLVNLTAEDPTLRKLHQHVVTGWPSKTTQVSDEVVPYFKIRDDLFYEDGLMYYNQNGDVRIIVPARMRRKILELIHKGHMGVAKCKSRAQQVFYWPLMMQHVADFVEACAVCAKFRPMNTKMPLIPHPPPTNPWEQVSIDIASCQGRDYLVSYDSFSKWLEIAKISSKSASAVINALKDAFCVNGNPEVIFADNNPFDSLEFRQFAKENSIEVITSSPHFPRSNGRAEKGVAIAKGILKKSQEERSDYRDSLKEYRNTVIPAMGASPAQLLNSRQLRTALPISKKQRKPSVQTGVHQKLRQQMQRTEAWYNKNARGSLSELKPGDKVYVKTNSKENWTPGVVKIKLPYPRSYLVTTAGSDVRRTREHLRPDLGKGLGEDCDFDYDFTEQTEQIPVRVDTQKEPEQAQPEQAPERKKPPPKKPKKTPEIPPAEPEYQLIVPDWLHNPYYVTLGGRTTSILKKKH